MREIEYKMSTIALLTGFFKGILEPYNKLMSMAQLKFVYAQDHISSVGMIFIMHYVHKLFIQSK